MMMAYAETTGRRQATARSAWLMGAVVLLSVAVQAEAVSSISLRSEAEVTDTKVTLADVARLRGAYAEELGEIVVAEIEQGQATVRLAMVAVRRKLDEREVHWGRLVCRGAQHVTVRRVERREEDKPEEAEEPAEANPVGVVATDEAEAEATAGRSLRERLHAWIAQQVGGGEKVDVRIAFEESDAPLLDAPLRGQRLEFEPLSTQPLGRVPVTVRRYAGEELAGTDRLRVEVEIRQPAVVAKRSLGRGQVISASDLEVKTVTLTNLRKKPLTEVESAAGKQSVGLIRPGGVLHVDDVAAPLLVRRGQMVTVRAVSGGVVLRMVGRAMDDGERGAVVKLRNERTRERFEARVTGPQEAVMNLDEDAAVAQREEGR